MTKPLLSGIAGCTFLILLDALSEMIESIVVRGVPITQVMEILSYKMIYLLSFTIPMGSMIGSLLAYGSMSDNNEIVAMNSLGISLKKILKPMVVLGICMSLFLLTINQFIVPIAFERQKDVLVKLAYEKPSFGLAEKQFLTNISGYGMYLYKFDYVNDTSGNFVIFNKTDKSKFRSIVTGDFAKWDDGYMQIYNSSAYEIDNNGEKQASIYFDRQDIPIRNKILNLNFLGTDDEENNMSIYSLIITIFNRSKRGLPYLRYSLALHTKLSLSFSPIFMAILGALLSANLHKRFKKGDGKLSGILMIFLYWGWIMTFRGIIFNNNLTAWIMWGPNLFFLILSLLVFQYRKRIR
jgi:lipopolysaccharide export system permease protein